MKLCPVCGSSFETARSDKKYCCYKCCATANRSVTRDTRIAARNRYREAHGNSVWGGFCAICGVKIEEGRWRKYCGKECRAESVRRSAKEHCWTPARKAYAAKWRATHRGEECARNRQYRARELERKRLITATRCPVRFPTCKQCGRLFSVRGRSTASLCSDECRQEAKRETWRKADRRRGNGYRRAWRVAKEQDAGWLDKERGRKREYIKGRQLRVCGFTLYLGQDTPDEFMETCRLFRQLRMLQRERTS